MKLIKIFGVAFLLFATPALAHDYWGNGREVDPATKQLCCGQNDCIEIPEARVHLRGGTYYFDDTPLTIPASRMQPSPDGRFWRCIWGYPKEIKCFFGPIGSS